MTGVIRKLVEKEIDILGEASMLLSRADAAAPSEKRIVTESVNSLIAQLKKMNNSVPNLLNSIEVPVEEKKQPKKEAKKDRTMILSEKLMLKESEKDAMWAELNINEKLMKKLKKKDTEEKGVEAEFQEARGYLKMANKYFRDTSTNLIKKGYFAGLPGEIKRANLNMLFESYVSMILLSTFLSIFAALFLVVILIIVLGFKAYLLAMIIVVPIGVFSALYYYPSAERGSIAKKIDEELPFAVIHMSSISGAGIEPTAIFKIIGLSREYPFLRKEIRKILNQINIYGYDLVTALNNVAKSTSSQKLAELLNGLSATINSGGSLSDFFQKRAETLLLGYKLDKEKSIKVAETFMDVYISVVIAAPMILMLMLVMISVSGIQTGFTPYQLTFITVGGVAIVNIGFLGFLQTKQT